MLQHQQQLSLVEDVHPTVKVCVAGFGEASSDDEAEGCRLQYQGLQPQLLVEKDKCESEQLGA